MCARRLAPVVFLLAFLVTPILAAEPTIYYVDIVTGADVPGNGSQGSPWQTVGYALSQVTGSAESRVEIRVAQGTYPGSITMRPYVDLYGGFTTAGWTHDIEAYETVLDGGGTVFHVVVGADAARIDGFTIRGGAADGAAPDNAGGGVFCQGTSPVVAHNRIVGNAASTGGGVYCGAGCAAQVLDNAIVGNAAGYTGAAVYAGDGAGAIVVEGNLITGNRGTYYVVLLATSPGSVFGHNRVLGNAWWYYGAVVTNGSVVDNLIWGGPLSTGGSSATLSLVGGAGPVVNNTVGRNPTGAAVAFEAAVCPDLANNLLHDATTYGVLEAATAGCQPVPRHNLFFGNGGGDYRDRNANVWTGATAINTNVTGAAGNVDGDPQFVTGPAGTWTGDGVFDAASYRTTFTDGAAGFTPGALGGLVLNPQTTQGRVLAIVGNTATTVTVEGDATDLGSLAGQPYVVLDYHLQNSSPAVDRGSLTTPGLPAVDLDGDARPGLDGRVDIGADESPDAFLPPVDVTPPVTNAGPLDGVVTAATFAVPWRGGDNGSGLVSVELFYRKGTAGAYVSYGSYATSPVSFVAALGDGLYQFYTMGTDADGNIEAAPASADADTTVVTAFAGPVVYVNGQVVGGTGDGSSWGNALRSVSGAVSLAAAYGVPQVWVAAGTYPGSVTLRSGVALYGGFGGTETALDQRDSAAHETVLDGGGTVFHVVVGADAARIDGFTIRGGAADGAAPDNAGGGVFCQGTSPVVAHNRIVGNAASTGGGVYCGAGCAAQVLDNAIVGNAAGYTGAAVYAGDGAGAIVVEGNLITGNRGTYYVVLLATSPGSVFRHNRVLGNAWWYYGAVVTNGSVVDNLIWGGPLSTGGSSATLSLVGGAGPVVNNTVGRNPTGAAVAFEAAVCPDLANNLLHDATTYGVLEAATAGCQPVPRHNLFFGNGGGDYRDRNANVWTGATAINTNVTGAAGNVDGDPQFVTGPAGTWTGDGVFDAASYRTTFTDGAAGFTPGALGGLVLNPQTTQGRVLAIVGNTATTVTVEGDATDLGSLAGQPYVVLDYHLQNSSPAVDRGSLTTPGLPAVDLDGDARPGLDGRVDIGADERDTTPPLVTVTEPNGGERIYIASPYRITWTASEGERIDHFDVFSSTDRGVTWIPVSGCTGLPGMVRSCNWSSSGPTTSNGRVKVVAEDVSGNVGADASNASFRILSGSPSVAVTSPNTAASWAVGTVHEIAWKHNAGAVSFFSIEVSRDGGVSWTLIAPAIKSATASVGRFDWTVTDPPSATARIRVTWTANPAIRDASNVNFTIASPVVTVTAPNTAVNWGELTPHTITWKHNLGIGSFVKIELSRDGGATYLPGDLVCAACPNTGATTSSFSWTVPAGTTTKARVRVSWTANPTVQDASNVNFTIGTPYITVTAPTPATVWAAGTAHSIKWKHNLGHAASVRIELSRDGGSTYGDLAVSVGNSSDTAGSYTWMVTGPASSTAIMRISWTSSPAVKESRAFVIGP